jgi:hypothetical protein
MAKFYIDGAAATSALDTAGEILDINGLDISSLPGAPFNWEHKSDTPQQIVGKILKAKKIFSEKDCENDRELYFWNKIQLPLVYVFGELFDNDIGNHVASIFKYDQENRGKTPTDTLGFSIEGAKLSKNGMVIEKSIARKTTVTANPANKTCIAESVPSEPPKPKNDIDSIFKSENFKTQPNTEIELIKVDNKAHLWELMNKKETPDDHAKALGLEKADIIQFPMRPRPDLGEFGAHIGNTKSDKPIHADKKVHQYEGFTPQDHKDAAALHSLAGSKAKDPKIKDMHSEKAKLHNSKANTMENLKPQKTAPAPIKKAMEAGSGMAAPGSLTQGAALAKESIDKKIKKGETGFERGIHTQSKIGDEGRSISGAALERKKNYEKRGDALGAKIAANYPKPIHRKVLSEMKQIKPKLTKSTWLTRAEEEFNSWAKKEEFIKFMQEKCPKLTKGEIVAIGQSMVLNKVLKSEEILAKLSNSKKDKK